MSIRLNKAIRELNIGLQTAVEFLRKRSDLGEVKEELSFKLSDSQYNALVEAFKSDKEVRSQAEKLLLKHPKEKKRQSDGNKERRADNAVRSVKPQKYTPLGKIDLDSLGKKPAAKPAAPAEKPQEAAVAEQPKPEVKESAAATVQAKSQEPKPEQPVAAAEKKPAEPAQPAGNTTAVVEEKKTEPEKVQPEAKPEAKAAEPQAQQPAAPEKPAEPEPVKEESKIFTLKSEKKLAPKVNVLGKIDLDSLNQSTRPKKKTKEERRKEREEKAMQAHPDGKKKRSRITKERVNIDQAVKQNNNGGGDSHADKGNAKKKNRKRNHKPLEVNEEDVARQVKETLARLTSKGQNKKGAKYRKEKREAAQEHLKEQRAEAKAESKTLKLTEFVTVSELASMMNVSVNQVIGTCMSVGIMVSINQRLDAETINLVADEFGFKTEYVSAEVSEAITEEEDDENDLVPRAPIVTVMGHVDHGKTSLLDHIRNTNVIAGEAGGITQHIGAYNVTLADGRKITFLDTPGHEAFTAMRARGAQVTDIAIIIISADDSVMPTTREAIAHAQAANVPMVFAINKIDKPGANPDKIREDLANMNLLVEEWGGKYQCQEISAKKGIGVDDLLEKVLLEAEMLDLKANPNRKATGSIIESSLDKGRGYVSTVLVSNGTLRVGDNVIAGTSYGRIKAMFNERNQRIEKASPAEPAIILGLNGAPTAGDTFHVLETEQEAREIANKRLQLQREQGLRTQKRLTLSDISHRIALGSFKELNIIVKGDTDGSIEALSDSFIKLSTEKIKVDVIYKAVGQISESDVTLADASDALIVGFQVRPSAAARKLADQEGVEINTYSVIYDAIEDVKSAMEGMLEKVKKEVVTGQVEVREVYHISKVGTVAGAYVTEGKVHRTDKARVVRDGIVVHTGEINALKRFKDDVKEVGVNFECGISLVNFNDIQVGDILETFMEIEVKQKL
ncbi:MULTISPECIES: translation initiation factor IF-2 [Prevotellaceae]|jgi:translation initiation factor IF-2|uniref:Translation initiation factor IF-2 n=1 Tax=Xylanibacter rarus TaxID=1676614 RepID=A0A8E1QX20_9BACT|nr:MULTISPECIES: translation initiation factor IF-2 [Prevotellaceae]KOO68298.1 translation initiation factor IF-2 [Xylanibacter rarus]CCX68896.1 translation initiation factor IF-2 [Prevotella sp. CAG:255]